MQKKSLLLLPVFALLLLCGATNRPIEPTSPPSKTEVCQLSSGFYMRTRGDAIAISVNWDITKNPPVPRYLLTSERPMQECEALNIPPSDGESTWLTEHCWFLQYMDPADVCLREMETKLQYEYDMR